MSVIEMSTTVLLVISRERLHTSLDSTASKNAQKTLVSCKILSVLAVMETAKLAQIYQINALAVRVIKDSTSTPKSVWTPARQTCRSMIQSKIHALIVMHLAKRALAPLIHVHLAERAPH